MRTIEIRCLKALTAPAWDDWQKQRKRKAADIETGLLDSEVAWTCMSLTAPFLERWTSPWTYRLHYQGKQYFTLKVEAICPSETTRRPNPEDHDRQIISWNPTFQKRVHILHTILSQLNLVFYITITTISNFIVQGRSWRGAILLDKKLQLQKPKVHTPRL